VKRLVVLLLALVIFVGCQTAPPTLVASQPEPTLLAAQPTAVPTATQTPLPTSTPTSTPTPAPTHTPTPVAPPTETPSLTSAKHVQVLCLKIEQSYPKIGDDFSLPLDATVRNYLDRVEGLKVIGEEGPCDGTLTITVTGVPLSARYTVATKRFPQPGDPVFPQGKTCYTGAKIEGEMSLVIPGRKPLSAPIEGLKGVTSTTRGCPGKKQAPFLKIWPEAALDALARIWGPSIRSSK